MAVKLSRHAFEHAKQFIDAGKVVFDERDAWSEHQPSSQQENDFIERHGFQECGNGIARCLLTIGSGVASARCSALRQDQPACDAKSADKRM